MLLSRLRQIPGYTRDNMHTSTRAQGNGSVANHGKDDHPGRVQKFDYSQFILADTGVSTGQTMLSRMTGCVDCIHS